jgi:tRNA U34 2-thiouridine synthase MnmA/TrmU
LKNQERIRAIGLLSGGLDSTLAAKILQMQGIDVLGVNFFTGFCISEHRRRFRRAKEGAGYGRNEALRAGKDLGIEVRMVDITEGYMDVLTKPKFGYGSAMNPCIDCRIYMLKKAAAIMEEEGAGFVFTGEVLGQRPMSQHMRALRLIEKESGLEGLILRPLSAQHLPVTVPEREGWVDREKLPGFRGRGRRDQQMKLAEELGVTDYPQPAGGCCFLTDHNYARRLRDLFEHCGTDRLSLDDVIMLKVGRHFRFPGGAKVVIGRNQEENEYLEGYRPGRCAIEVDGFPGPLTLLEGEVGRDDLLLAAALTAGYSKGAGEPEVDVKYTGFGGDADGAVTVAPLPPDRAREWLI